jgi:hypothetical protein
MSSPLREINTGDQRARQSLVHRETFQALNTVFLNVFFRNGSASFGFNEGRRTEECITLLARPF